MNLDDRSRIEALERKLNNTVDRVKALESAFDNKDDKIADDYIRLDSFTRAGITHTIRVKDGIVDCSCESAFWHPETPCKHVNKLYKSGKLDARVKWIGYTPN